MTRPPDVTNFAAIAPLTRSHRTMRPSFDPLARNLLSGEKARAKIVSLCPFNRLIIRVLPTSHSMMML